MKDILKRAVIGILTKEAKLLLKRTKPTIVAITGNVGKTSTKDAIYAAIKDSVPARKSEKSYNSEIGVPLSILGLENAWSNPVRWLKNILDGLLLILWPGVYPKVLVLEVGVDRPGDMKKLTEWLKPDVVVLTRLPDVPVHVEYFSDPSQVVAEKLELVHALKADGVLIYNHDDEKINQAVETVRQKALGYGRYAPTDFTATGDEIVYQDKMPIGTNFNITHAAEKDTIFLTGVVGTHHIYSIAAACAVASLFDISLQKAAKGFKDYSSPPGRMRILPGIKDTVIIDDTYNSSPTATERALSTLAEMKCGGNRIAVLGDMLELGQYSVTEHEKVGQQVAQTAEVLFTVGVRARKIAESAMEHGMSEKRIFQYDEAVFAGRELQNYIQKGDVILVKGSQGVRCERIVAEIMSEPDKAGELLVRQSEIWLSKA